MPVRQELNKVELTSPHLLLFISHGYRLQILRACFHLKIMACLTLDPKTASCEFHGRLSIFCGLFSA